MPWERLKKKKIKSFYNHHNSKRLQENSNIEGVEEEKGSAGGGEGMTEETGE